jgi:hypothetical protein
MSHILKGCQFCREEASRYNFLQLSRTLRPVSASSSPQSRTTVRERHYPAFASAARSKM